MPTNIPVLPGLYVRSDEQDAAYTNPFTLQAFIG